MTSPRNTVSVAGAAILLALFVAGSLAARALALPLPPAVVGVAAVLLGLRIGVMIAALEEPSRPPARPMGRGADEREPALRAANG